MASNIGERRASGRRRVLSEGSSLPNPYAPFPVRFAQSVLRGHRFASPHTNALEKSFSLSRKRSASRIVRQSRGAIQI